MRTTKAVPIEVGVITRVKVAREVVDTEEIKVEVVSEDTTPPTMEDCEERNGSPLKKWHMSHGL